MAMQLKKGKNKRGIIATAGLLLLSKLKWLLAILKFSKFGLTFISLIVSLAGYAVFYGWRFAVALVYLIFIHEMGHLVAARRSGVKTSPAVFVPFMGAVIGMKEKPKNAIQESFIAYGGPLAGLLSIIPAIFLYFSTNQSYWLLVMMLGALLNLFNLIPISPLDGGRIVSVLSTKIWFIGLLILIVYTMISPSPLLFLILLFGILTWWRRLRESYRLMILQHKTKKTLSWMKTLIHLKTELFYQVHQEEAELDYLNDAMKQYFIRNYRDQLYQLTNKLNSLRKVYVPFIEDKKKLKRDLYLIDKHLLEEKIKTVEGVFSKEDIDHHFQAYEKQIHKYQEELAQTRTYYEAKAQTKWKVLIAYVALALILSVIFFYSREMLNQVTPFIS